MSDLPNQITELLPENLFQQEIVITQDEQGETECKLILAKQLSGCFAGQVDIGLYVLADKQGVLTTTMGSTNHPESRTLRRPPNKTTAALLAVDRKTGKKIRLGDIDVQAYGSALGSVPALNHRVPLTGSFTLLQFDPQNAKDAIRKMDEDHMSELRPVTLTWTD